MGEGSDPNPRDGTTAAPPPINGKREADNENETQVTAKKQKRDEVAEEQTNKEEITSHSEPAKMKMDIDEGDNYEESDEVHKKMIEVLKMDADSNAGELLKNVANDYSGDSSYNDDNDNESSDVIEKSHSHMVTTPVVHSDSSEDSEEEIEKETSKTPQATPITLAAPREKNAGSKTICAKNLSYSVERVDLENLFKDCGEVVDVRLHTDDEGRFRGFGHVEFATAEAAQKALELNNTELLRCPIRVVIAQERRRYTSYRSLQVNKFGNSFQRSEILHPMNGSEISEDCEQEIDKSTSKTLQESHIMLPDLKEQSARSKTIRVRNLSYSVEQADMENFFKECGEVVDIRLQTDYEGRFEGFGHVEFATSEAAWKDCGMGKMIGEGHEAEAHYYLQTTSSLALALHNTELLRRRVKVKIAREKGAFIASRRQNSFQKSDQPLKGTESLEYCGEAIDEKACKTPWPKMLTTLKEENATTKTIYVQNLSYRVKRADMENLFKECGEIVNIRLHMDHDGKFKGYAHVDFATAKAAREALELDNTEFLGRCIRVCIAQEKGECTSNRSNWRNSSQKSENVQSMKGTASLEYHGEAIDEKASKTPWESPKMFATLKEENPTSKAIYVRNLFYGVKRADIENHFKMCGEIVNVRLHTDHDGRLKGNGHVEFATAEAVQKALELNDTELLGRSIQVFIARGKREYTCNRSSWKSSFQKSETIQPMKSTENSEDCEEDTEEKSSKTSYESAVELDNTEFLGHCIRVCTVQEKGERTSHTSNWRSSSQKSESVQPMKGTASLEYHEEAIDEKASKTPRESSKMLATLKEENPTSKAIYVRNLFYGVKRADIENHFKMCGEIVNVRLHTDHDGRLKGNGHVEFATAEAVQKALELNDTELLGRPIQVFIARGKREYTCNRSNWNSSFQKSETTQPMKGTENSEDWKEDSEEKSSKTPHKSPRMLANPKEQNAASKTIYVWNLSCEVERADMENHFKKCGEIVDVRLRTYREWRLKGYGHVEFATTKAVQNALELDNTELLNRPIRVSLARESGESSRNRSHLSNSFQKYESIQSQTVFVKGFDTSLTRGKIKASMEEHFGSCGEITGISIPKFHDSDLVKGFAHLEFKDVDSAKKAVLLDQSELGGYTLLVEMAKPKPDYHGSSSDGSGYSGLGRGKSSGIGWHSSFFS